MIALLFALGMTRFFILSAAIGMVASAVSLGIAFFLDLPVGPTTVAVLALAYLLCWSTRRLGEAFVNRST
jgi:ABC-type Mn2+/Zn2+ transport system permease subunit